MTPAEALEVLLGIADKGKPFYPHDLPGLELLEPPDPSEMIGTGYTLHRRVRLSKSNGTTQSGIKSLQVVQVASLTAELRLWLETNLTWEGHESTAAYEVFPQVVGVPDSYMARRTQVVEREAVSPGRPPNEAAQQEHERVIWVAQKADPMLCMLLPTNSPVADPQDLVRIAEYLQRRPQLVLPVG